MLCPTAEATSDITYCNLDKWPEVSFWSLVAMQASHSSSSPRAPYYILVSLKNSNISQATSATTLKHPRIQYLYADDSPLSLLPSHPEEHVLLLDAGTSSTATVHSISPELITTGLKVEDAPAASAVEATDGSRMYIIEATRDERYVEYRRYSFSIGTHTFVESQHPLTALMNINPLLPF